MNVLWEQPNWWIPWSVVVLSSILACWCDVRRWRIPNLLTIPLFFGGLAYSAFVAGWVGLGESLLGVLIAGFPFIVLYALAGGGAGDAKMMMALGAWVGVIGAAVVLLGVGVMGGIAALVYAVRRKHFLKMARNLEGAALGAISVAKRKMRTSDAANLMPVGESSLAMPYGIAIAVGAVVSAGGVTLWKL